MNLRWAASDAAACSAPGRLRHSWLDNQVLLVLRQASITKIRPERLVPIIAGWCHDVEELQRYASAFPDIVDPGIFLRRFAEKKGRHPAELACAALSVRFEMAFAECMHESTQEYRHSLIAASDKFSVALENLLASLNQSVHADIISEATLTPLAEAREAAEHLHELLGAAPRGVCLV